MSNLDHKGFLETEAMIVPPRSSYQARAISDGAYQLVDEDGDLLIEAPTGAGKTRMLADLAKEVCDRRDNGKALIVTHRRNLHRQMSGNPEGKTTKEQLGEIAFWSGEKPGTIAEAALGGINQDSSIVIAMVETAANLDDLSGYTDIFIDEGHHASEESSTRETAGSYAKIIERCPDAHVTAVTATSFRGDDGKLHPRLENAKRIVIGVEETQNEGRTVKAKTHVSKARLTNGMTPSELYRAEQEGKLERSAAAIMRESKGEEYYQASLEEWEKVSGHGSTIAFTDSVDEIETVTSHFNKTFGPGTAGMIHGGLRDAQNDAVIEAYKRGDIKVLVSCKMIGEGFDVPKTDNVMSFNSSISRGEMNQIVGRCVRSSDGKSYGNFIDCGTSSARHGLIEEQHKLQSVRALALSGNRGDELRALGRAACREDGGWNIAPGENASIFFRQFKGDKFEAFKVQHDLMRTEGRRVTGGADAGRSLERIFGPDDAALMDVSHLAGMVGEHVQQEAGFIARAGGLRGSAYVQRGSREMDSWKMQLDALSPGKGLEDLKRTPSAQEREENIRRAVRGEERSQIGLKAVSEVVKGSRKPIEGLREGIHLSGVALGEMAKSEDTPLGLRKDCSAMSYNVMASNVKEMKPSELVKYSKLLQATFGAAESAGISPSAAKVTKSLGEMMQTSERRAREAFARRNATAR